jgi:ribosomal protein S17E
MIKLTQPQVETDRCKEEEVVLDEKFRNRITRNVKRNKRLLAKLAEF